MKQHTIVLSVCMVMALLLAACNGTGSKKVFKVMARRCDACQCAAAAIITPII